MLRNAGAQSARSVHASAQLRRNVQSSRSAQLTPQLPASQRCQQHEPRTDGGSTGPPRKPPRPPRATAELPADDSGAGDGKGGGWQGWRDRVDADPKFVFKVLTEQIIGVGASVLGDMSTRPNWGINELDFVFSTLIVGSIVNFSLMYLLAPTVARAGTSAVASKGLGKLFDPKWLLSKGAPGGHIFEAGFSARGRALNLGVKGAMFGVIGFAAGIAGTCISNSLIMARQKLDSNYVSQNVPPNVLLNALGWTLHMGVSSNVRYQALNGLEGVLVSRINPFIFSTLVVAVRTINNVIGGVSFVCCARMVGSQKPAAAVDPPVVQAEEKAVRKMKKVVA